MPRVPVKAAMVGAILFAFSTIAPLSARNAPDENPAAPLSDHSGGVVTTTPWVIGLISEGMASSPTFAGITSQLLASNVIATVEPELQIKTGLSGYMVFVTRTSYRRYLRIYFDPRLQRWHQISIIGHELRHALEVALHPEVVNQATLRVMYASEGHGEGDRWDSDGAVEAGRVILHELSQAAAVLNAEDR